MKHPVQYQTREGEPICHAGHRDYTTIRRAIKLALKKGFTSLVATDGDGSLYDYTTWLENRRPEAL